ncbi:MAG: EAL domain-containing protein, partial [Cetobacterium sp.]
LQRYETIIKEASDKRESNIFKSNFLNSLTDFEKEYLKTLNLVEVGVKLDNSLNYYSKNSNRYIGVIPLFIENFSKNTGVNLKVMSDRNNNWDNIYDDFLNKKIKVLPLSGNKEWNEDIIFSMPIYEPVMYKISGFYSNVTKIGVVKNSVEENFAKDFYIDSDINRYENHNDLEKALNTKEINIALLFDINKMDTSKFKVNELEKVQIFLAFNKEDIVLRDIFNKFIKNSTNLKTIIESADMLKKQDAFNEYQKYRLTNDLLMSLLIIAMLLVVIFICKIVLNQKITKELKRDSTTKIPNRKAYLNFVSKKKILKGYAVALDIDNFKEVNYKYGQITGDYILLGVGCAIKKIFKNEDIFRVSGDEFYIFSKEEFILERLKELKDELKDLSLTYQLEFSIGYYNNKDDDLESCFKFAGMALEESKKKSETYYLEATEDLLKRNRRENSIKSFLRNQDFKGLYAVYQPKFSIKNKKIVGGESLARWSDEKLGFISPVEFIPVAEKIDLIHLIDFEIASQTIKFVKRLKESNLIQKGFKMSFNLSMKTLERDDVVTKIKSLLDENNISGEFLEVEITETIFSTNLKTTLRKIEDLKKLGFTLAMDDFTAGHSTVSLLPLLPLDVVKFDKAILDSIGIKDDLVSSNIYTALVRLVKDLNVIIIAEGIETDLQLNFLEKALVDIGQGYIFSKPITDSEFENRIKK